MKKKLKVLYKNGDSRENPGCSVDYMQCNLPYPIMGKSELYSETEGYADGMEFDTFDFLMTEIIEQAEELGLPVEMLDFYGE